MNWSKVFVQMVVRIVAVCLDKVIIAHSNTCRRAVSHLLCGLGEGRDLNVPFQSAYSLVGLPVNKMESVLGTALIRDIRKSTVEHRAAFVSKEAVLQPTEAEMIFSYDAEEMVCFLSSITLIVI